jgi:hypothetical protein
MKVSAAEEFRVYQGLRYQGKTCRRARHGGVIVRAMDGVQAVSLHFPKVR